MSTRKIDFDFSTKAWINAKTIYVATRYFKASDYEIRFLVSALDAS